MLCSSKVRELLLWPLSAPYKWLITVSACRHRRQINAKTLHIFMNISANAFVFLGNIKNITRKIYFHIHWLFIVQAIDSVLSWASFISPFHTLQTDIHVYRGLCDMNLHNPSKHKIIIESYSNWFLLILKSMLETVKNVKGLNFLVIC